jgi:hypothetical protein
MRDVVFAMELRGRAAPVDEKGKTLKAKTSGRGPHGESVMFESRVVLRGETFNETGSIDYSGRGKLTFETVGAGEIRSSPVPGLQWGVVTWRITKGEGEFGSATGYITSNFTVSAEGDVVDNQYVRILIP